ncbi:MAG TPA: TetR/AcrR family transcriptional regulator [Longimicrobiales bacterium]|nr:TetR/AcrR family transcriptional regulator [Longimicrobiales bacterium]
MSDKETAGRILDAAAELFSTRGFARTTIRQIADRAAANSALIYYYFGSKGGLLEALVEKVQDAVHANLKRALGLSGTPREKLARFIALQVELLRRRSPLLRILMREVLNQNELVLFALRRAVEPNLALVTGLIREGIDAGEFREVDATLAARTLIGSLLVPVVLAPLVLGDDGSIETDVLTEHIIGLYLGGIEA